MKEEIEKLKHGECYTVPESDYGKAEIYRLNQVYVVFEIPFLGGDPIYKETYSVNLLGMLIRDIESLT